MNYTIVRGYVKSQLLFVAQVLVFISFFFYAPDVVSAQYVGSAPLEAQVLGESTSSGVPTQYMWVAILLITLGAALLFFTYRRRAIR